jgi:hypothetical protein
MPHSHEGRTGNCQSCHPAVGVIMPTSAANPNHFGQTAGHPGAGACESCHTFNVLDEPPAPISISTTVVVTGDGEHTIEYWGEDEAGNVETPHKFANFEIGEDEDIPTTITIRTSATSVRRGPRSSFILSGVVTPQSLIGTNVQVMVKKPDRRYYSYSSLRTVYSNRGVASWWYRYGAVSRLVPGIYRFYAFVPATSSETYLRSQSGVVSVNIRR